VKRLGIIGAGSLADTVLSTLAEQTMARLDFLSVLVSARGRDEARLRLDLFAALAKEIVVRTELTDFVADRVELVAECAGHSAVRQHGAAILASGTDLVLASIGSLADDDLRDELQEAARSGGSRLMLPAGAVGGVDVLAAARLSGLRSVRYTGRKPPRAWAGTAAEQAIDLVGLAEPTVFFEGTARQAAQTYPQNANVAAIVALAGLGFDKTRVRLVADPGISCNMHEIAVESVCANFTIAVEGRASPTNPKTSLTAGFSVARQILNRTAELVI
jgi:aspartate dehydrogenase